MLRPQGLIPNLCLFLRVKYTLIKFNVYPPNHRFTVGDIGSLKECPLQELDLSGGFGSIMKFTGEYDVCGVKISSGRCLRASGNNTSQLLVRFMPNPTDTLT